MTELHLALIAAGVALLLLLFAWSKWQQRRQARRRDADEAPAVPAPAEAGRVEPRLGDLAAAAPQAEPPRPQPARWIEDPMLDAVLELHCAHGVDGVAVIDAVAPLARLDCGLPVHVVAWDARAEGWVEPDRFGFYSEMLAGIQLANRGGRLGDIEASKFIAAVQQAAMALEADFDPPELAALRRRAEQLEALVAQFDVQIGFTVQVAADVTPSEVNRAALAVGLTPAGEGRWLRADGEGRALFTARLQPSRLLLELDVPTVPPQARPLPAMFAAAAELAVLLKGQVVDDHGRPLLPAAVEAIEPALQSLYERMRAADLEPGSARACRLFASA